MKITIGLVTQFFYKQLINDLLMIHCWARSKMQYVTLISLSHYFEAQLLKKSLFLHILPLHAPIQCLETEIAS